MNKMPEQRVTYSDTREIKPELIQDLREQVGWGADTAKVWENTLTTAIAVASSWDDERLVGIGFLVGCDRNALVCDLVVDPTYQQKGIGRTILNQILEVARSRNIKYLTLTYDPEKPWLKDFYASCGFLSIPTAMQLVNY